MKASIRCLARCLVMSAAVRVFDVCAFPRSFTTVKRPDAVGLVSGSWRHMGKPWLPSRSWTDT
jgi:hypothetical protein